ncbi:hypothetical protein AXF42_Ash003673 [Apostasia shenzhenica]|uniref:Small ribosomal subunit protein mS23 n=1 Tax=Apostasia shenzhenica TaxID=1088818 RepID=A0A2I0AHS8_9ASPA|nr:hypothetical protein AXF42_Ash003673 [Apostasia shenzhenica]
MRKLVKGLARPTPAWLKAMEEAPPVVFPRTDGKIKKIELPEDVYVQRFFKKHPDSLYHDPVRISGFDPPPARIFAWRVLELKGQGVSEEDATAVADMEYMNEKKAKKKAYSELKKIARLQGKKPPPNPYPSAIKEIQAEERKYVQDRFFNPKILDIVKKMKEEKAAKMQERMAAFADANDQRTGRNERWQLNKASWDLFACHVADGGSSSKKISGGSSTEKILVCRHSNHFYSIS